MYSPSVRDDPLEFSVAFTVVRSSSCRWLWWTWHSQCSESRLGTGARGRAEVCLACELEPVGLR